MTKRARIVLLSATALLAVALLGVGAALGAVQTRWGRDRIRDIVMTVVRPRVHGSLYVGRITSGFLTGVTVDSLAIRDSQDSLFVSSGPVTVHYDLRDLWDRRFLLRGVRAEHPIVYLRQHEDGTWNFQHIFPSSPPSPLEPKSAPPFIEIDSATVRDGTFLLTQPWHLNPRVPRAARDSVLREQLAAHEIHRTGEGLARTWRWTGANLSLLHGRISHPDSAGMAFQLAKLSVRESDPPFIFRDARAIVRQLGDSLWVDVPHFDLPGSTGSGRGKVVWGSDLPTRYDVHVQGDSVSLADVAWVYATLPRTGGGHTLLDIHSEHDPHYTDYVLSDMDVRSERSRLRGGMTFVIGYDTLVVRDVRVAADPVNFDLLRTLNGKPFPYNWQGDLTGTVRASGGNLARFKVEDAQVVFADANVPGAISRASGRGELNIFQPAFTAFNEFAVDVGTLDLRTLQYLNKEFPRLGGTVAGTAVLDSSWLDLRFHDAQLTHRDGDGPESHVSGNGRVTWGDKYLTYDLTLDAAPLAFATIRKSYQGMPLRASMSGPLRIVGQSPDLQVTATLADGADTLTWSGRVDADPPVFGAHGTGLLAHADLQKLLAMDGIPPTSLSGTYALDVSGDSVVDFVGTAAATLATSRIGTVALAPSSVRARFDRGIVHVDTLALRSGDARVDATGTVALVGGTPGVLHYDLALPHLARLDAILGRPVTPAGLAGALTASGTLTGTPSALVLTGTATARGLALDSAGAARATGTYALHDVTNAPSGTVRLTLDSVHAAFLPVDRASLTLDIAGGRRAAFHADLTDRGTTRGSIAGILLHDSVQTVVALDSLALVLDSANTVRLAAPAHLVANARTVTVDSLLLRRAAGEVVAIRGVRLAGDSVRASVRTDGFSLALLGLTGAPIANPRGTLTVAADVAGTFQRPRLFGKITVQNGGMLVIPAGTNLTALDADIALDGDTVRVRRLAAATQGERRGTLGVTGTIALDRPSDPSFNLRADAHNFRAVNRRGLATLDVSTTRPITLNGSYDGAVVTGDILVDRGTIYIPEVVRKRVLDLSDPELYDVVDTTVASDRAILPRPPSELARHLRLQNVGVRIGDDVWLRSAEANIKLGGSLTVALGGSPGSDRPQLALEGELVAQRGTYQLDVVPFVQPTFDVEQGTLRFYGTPDLNPTLDITAITIVRKPVQSLNGQDVRVRATIGGTLTQPTLTLSSADNLPLSQSDLLSYLITGQPSFALDYTTQQYVNQLAAVAVRSAGNLISSAIPRSVFDVVELQTPTVVTPGAQSGAEAPTFYNNLLNTRAVLGKQLNNNLFLNFSTGFCAETFRKNLGIRLEYRLGPTYTAQVGLEPGSSDLACARPGAVEALQQTPPQFGIDFLRSWRF